MMDSWSRTRAGVGGARRAIAARVALASVWAMGVCIVGCVDRRLEITSVPSGALVHLNDQEIGRTPVEANFEWFGVYDIRLTLDGYEPLSTQREAHAPLHEQPGIDLLMLPMPFTKRTRIAWHFELEPLSVDQAALIDRGMELGRRFGGDEQGAVD
ncbi:MAG: PEGA domain-containing protein [Phycisphaerales bacterium]